MPSTEDGFEDDVCVMFSPCFRALSPVYLARFFLGLVIICLMRAVSRAQEHGDVLVERTTFCRSQTDILGHSWVDLSRVRVHQPSALRTTLNCGKLLMEDVILHNAFCTILTRHPLF